MPYKIVKVAKGYYVKNMKTGKRYSEKPMTKANAEAQLRILELIDKR